MLSPRGAGFENLLRSSVVAPRLYCPGEQAKQIECRRRLWLPCDMLYRKPAGLISRGESDPRRGGAARGAREVTIITNLRVRGHVHGHMRWTRRARASMHDHPSSASRGGRAGGIKARARVHALLRACFALAGESRGAEPRGGARLSAPPPPLSDHVHGPSQGLWIESAAVVAVDGADQHVVPVPEGLLRPVPVVHVLRAHRTDCAK